MLAVPAACRCAERGPKAAAEHAVSVHGHEDTPEFREELRGFLEPAEAYSNAPRGANFYIVWFNCAGVSPLGTCSGRSSIVWMMPGWNTYVVPLGATAGNNGSFPANWGGRVNGLRIVFNAGASYFKMDQARLYQRNSGVGVTVPGLSNGDLVWDKNTSDADNVQASGWATSGTSSPYWGVLRRDQVAMA